MVLETGVVVMVAVTAIAGIFGLLRDQLGDSW